MHVISYKNIDDAQNYSFKRRLLFQELFLFGKKGPVLKNRLTGGREQQQQRHSHQ